MLHYLSCDGLALRVELLWAGLRADSFWAVWEFNSGGKKKKKKSCQFAPVKLMNIYVLRKDSYRKHEVHYLAAHVHRHQRVP